MADRFPVTLVDSVAYLLRMRAETGVINCVLSLSGQIDESRLRRAVRLAMDAEPILGCRFVERWYRPYWSRRTDLDELPLCEVVSGDDDPCALAHFLTASLDPARDPLLKALVLRAKSDTVCLKSSHTVGDGPSFVRVVELVLRIYCRLKEDPKLVPVPNLAGVRHLQDLGRQLSFRQRLQVVRDIRASRSAPAATWGFPEITGRKPFCGYVMLKLGRDRVRELTRYARHRGATMTSLLLVASYLAARDVCQVLTSGFATLAVTADLRRFLPRKRRQTAVSNMSSPWRVWFDPRRDADFDEILAFVRDQLKRVKDPTQMASSASLFIAFPPLRACFALLPLSLIGHGLKSHLRRTSSRPERRLCLANMGEIDLQPADLHDLSVDDAYFTGPVSLGPGVSLICSTFRGALTLTLGVSDRVMDIAAARRLLEQVDRHLPFHSAMPGTVSALESARDWSDVDGGLMPRKPTPTE